jgi:hypothetical protein
LLENNCTTCKHSGASFKFAIACYRPKTFASGRVLKAPRGVGFPTFNFELGPDTIYDGRADGDACGPLMRNWEARA